MNAGEVIVNPHAPHDCVYNYDGAFFCYTCRAEWGALPGHPEMPKECIPWACPHCKSPDCESKSRPIKCYERVGISLRQRVHALEEALRLALPILQWAVEDTQFKLSNGMGMVEELEKELIEEQNALSAAEKAIGGKDQAHEP